MKKINIDLKLFKEVTIFCGYVTVSQIRPILNEFNIEKGYYEREESIDEDSDIPYVSVKLQENLHLLEGDMLERFILKCKNLCIEIDPKFGTEQLVHIEF